MALKKQIAVYSLQVAIAAVALTTLSVFLPGSKDVPKAVVPPSMSAAIGVEGKPQILASVQAASVVLTADLPTATPRTWSIVPGSAGKSTTLILAVWDLNRLATYQYSLGVDAVPPGPGPGPGPQPPLPDPGPAPVPDPPKPVPPAGPALLLITATGDWCEACKQTKSEILPKLQPQLGERLKVVDYATPEAKTAFPESAFVPRWVLTRPDGKRETRIGFLSLDQLNAWMGGAGHAQ